VIARRRLARLLAQVSCLLVIIVLLWPALPWQAGPKFATSASPFVAVSSSIATRSVGLAAGTGFIFTLLAFTRRRWFCRYVCPTGLILDGVARMGPGKTSPWAKCPPLGQYVALLTLGGALIGYPFLLWLDPMAIISSPFAGRGNADLTSGVLAGICLGILIPVSYIMGTVWCVRLCPLGGLQDLLGVIKSFFVTRLASLRTGTVLNKQTPGKSFSRRIFLSGMTAGGLGLGLWGRKAGLARAETVPLRPPGAVSEDRFTGLCIRCNNCTTACPTKIIHPDRGLSGTPGLLSPTLRYTGEGYCRKDCNLCTQVCPSGALQALDLQQKQQYIIGEALVDSNICLTTLGQKDCDACVIACPYDAVEIYWDEEMYVAYPRVDYTRCNGCGACEIACPTERFKAISVWSLIPDTAAGDGLVPSYRYLDRSSEGSYSSA
jgi:ferredoxin